MLIDVFEVNLNCKLGKGIDVKYFEMVNVLMSGYCLFEWIGLCVFGLGFKFLNGDVLLVKIILCLENGKLVFVDFFEDIEVGWGLIEFIVLCFKLLLLMYVVYLLVWYELFWQYVIQVMIGISGCQ